MREIPLYVGSIQNLKDLKASPKTRLAVSYEVYGGTSLIRTPPVVGPYRSPI